MTDKPNISIILPIYNEERIIGETVKSIFTFMNQTHDFGDYEIIAVNDGSRDKTGQILEALKSDSDRLQIVTHSKNAGYGTSIESGVKAAKYPWIMIMDADGQFRIDSLNDVTQYMPDYDVIAGYRLKRNDNWFRVLLGKTFTFINRVLFGLKLRDLNCGFKIFRKETLDLQGLVCTGSAIYSSIFIKTAIKGFRVKQVPIEHFPRKFGKATGASVKVVLVAFCDIFRLIAMKQKLKNRQGS